MAIYGISIAMFLLILLVGLIHHSPHKHPQRESDHHFMRCWIFVPDFDKLDVLG